MEWKGGEDGQMENFRARIGERKKDRMRNERIRELVDVCKRADKILNERMMRLYVHTERMNDRCDRPRKRWREIWGYRSVTVAEVYGGVL